MPPGDATGVTSDPDNATPVRKPGFNPTTSIVRESRRSHGSVTFDHSCNWRRRIVNDRLNDAPDASLRLRTRRLTDDDGGGAAGVPGERTPRRHLTSRIDIDEAGVAQCRAELHGAIGTNVTVVGGDGHHEARPHICCAAARTCPINVNVLDGVERLLIVGSAVHAALRRAMK